MVCSRSLFFCCASSLSTCGLQPHVYTFSSSSITTLWKNPADMSLTGPGKPLTLIGLVTFENNNILVLPKMCHKNDHQKKANLFVVPVAHLTEETTAEGPDVALLRQQERVRVAGVDLGYSVSNAPVNQSSFSLLYPLSLSGRARLRRALRAK